jgi:DNA-binding NtrC family response regulator
MKTENTQRHRILIADDQADIRGSLRLLLKNEGFETYSASSPSEALVAIEAREFDAVLMDLNYTRDTTSGKEGLDLLTAIQRIDNALPVIVMTAWSSVELAVEAMRLGARDFLQKPWENARLLNILRTQIDLRQALRRASRLEAENRLLNVESRPAFIAESEAMQPVLNLVSRIGPSDASVLITGEHGTGKEVVARTLHALSGRSARPMVTVNAGGLSGGLFESELFGHVKGAFTDARTDRMGRFEFADNSTLFLDEIANVPMNLQAKLLRVLETGEFERVGSSHTRRVNVRILAATNVDVNGEVAAGRFREDLLFRLNTIEIQLPALRERQRDIDLLANHFLRIYMERYRKKITGFDAPAVQALHDHPWPGNVRELDHTIEHVLACNWHRSVHLRSALALTFTGSTSFRRGHMRPLATYLLTCCGLFGMSGWVSAQEKAASDSTGDSTRVGPSIATARRSRGVAVGSVAVPPIVRKRPAASLHLPRLRAAQPTLQALLRGRVLLAVALALGEVAGLEREQVVDLLAPALGPRELAQFLGRVAEAAAVLERVGQLGGGLAQLAQPRLALGVGGLAQPRGRGTAHAQGEFTPAGL